VRARERRARKERVMSRQLQIGSRGYYESPADSFDNSGLDDARVVTTNHKLLTSAWTADVTTLETAIGQFTARRPLANPCHVVFFEIAGDGELHVNVTHQHPTTEVRGWAGPARLPDGFVHNRRFGDTAPAQMLRHIRDMVFAARI
jgi:hypothetical protein